MNSSIPFLSPVRYLACVTIVIVIVIVIERNVYILAEELLSAYTAYLYNKQACLGAKPLKF